MKEQKIQRMVEIVDVDTCTPQLIREVLEKNEFSWISSDGELSRFADSQSEVKFFLKVSKSHVQVTAVDSLPNSLDSSAVAIALNELNVLSLIGVHRAENISDNRWLFSDYSLPIFSAPLGFHTGWLAAGVRSFCFSRAWILKNFLTMVSRAQQN